MEKPQTEINSTTASPTYTPFRSAFASLSMHKGDCLRVLSFPPAAISAVQLAVRQTWPNGIQSEQPYAGTHEFKLRGWPWSSNLADDAMHAQRCMTRVLEALAGLGWVLVLSTDVSRNKMDNDTLLFRLQQRPLTGMSWTSMAFVKGDRLRLVDAPEELVRATLGGLAGRVQSHGPFGIPGVYEVKLTGYPWRAGGEETMEVRRVLLVLLEALERCGFTIYASVEQNATANKHASETDTWHCCRQADWVAGMPVFHV